MVFKLFPPYPYEEIILCYDSVHKIPIYSYQHIKLNNYFQETKLPPTHLIH